MKSLNNIRIALLIVGLLISSQLASKETANYLNLKFNDISTGQLNQTEEEIKIIATNELGKDPGFDGLKVLLSKLKVKVEKKLRGNIPYRIKSTIKDGTIIPFRIGNQLRLEVTLIKCEESTRHWFFEAAAGIYSYNNNPSMGPITSAVKLKVMEKARASSFPSQQILGLFPSHSSLIGFSNLNTGDPNKEYKIVFEFLTAQRPADYVEVVNDALIDANSDVFGENNKLTESVIPLPNNQQVSVANNDIINYQQNNTRKSQQNTSSNSYKNHDSHVNSSKNKVESPFYKYLNVSDKILLSKILNSEMNYDPKGNGGSSFTRCGQKIGNCRWCGKSSSFTTYFNTIGYLIRSANNNIQIPFAFNYQDMGQLIKELKQYLNMVRSGKYYVCQTDSNEMFCSPKCKYEFNHSR